MLMVSASLAVAALRRVPNRGLRAAELSACVLGVAVAFVGGWLRGPLRESALGCLAFPWMAFGLVMAGNLVFVIAYGPWTPCRSGDGLHWNTRIVRDSAVAVFVSVVVVSLLSPTFWGTIVRDVQWEAVLCLVLLNLGGVAPLEETVFRGRLLDASLRFLRTDLALVLQAALFAAIHAPGLICVGSLWGRPQIAVFSLSAVFAQGWLFGYLRMRTGTLVSPIVCHGLVNTALELAIVFGPVPPL